MPYFAYNVGGWVQKEGKMCLRNKSMAPYESIDTNSAGIMCISNKHYTGSKKDPAVLCFMH